MANYRSEDGKFTNKPYYADLSMSLYPNTLDTRDSNLNMRGFVNVGEVAKPDYVMAEYVNAATDSLMAIERALGVLPMVPANTPTAQIPSVVQNETVSTRIARIEDGELFDERYGGTGWVYGPNRATLIGHKHTGVNGQPSQIDLALEVKNLLPKANIDLSQETGVTAMDIRMSRTDGSFLGDSLVDKLSRKSGGTVSGAVSFTGGMNNLTSKEFTTSQFMSSSMIQLVSDSSTLSRQAKVTDGVAEVYLLNQSLSDLQYGRYVLGVRVKVSATGEVPVLQLQAGQTSTVFLASDFEAANTWKMVYLVFDYDGASSVQIRKLSTGGTSIKVSVDHAYITPAHPAVFDR